ncbi:SGNH/GDSL hydrolase family protein [Lysobacter xanthus]
MLRYLALGDSYTIGEGVEAEDRWPVRLVRALRHDDIAIAEPRIVAATGWTTDELAAGIAAAQPLGHFDLVSLCIGVNDQYRGRSLAEYRAQLEPLLRTAVQLAGGRSERVLMLSIPDWGATRFARDEGHDAHHVGREIDAFNHAAQDMCESRRIAFVDITPASREDGDSPSMLTSDGLHPSRAMYARWVEIALPAVHGLLGAE